MTLRENPSASTITLSPRHIEILTLLKEGKSNKEIAEELKIQEGTVKQHLFVLYRELGVSSRAKAAIVAEQILKNKVSTHTKDSPKPFNPAAKSVKNAGQVTSRYDWRLVSSVAIVFPEEMQVITDPKIIPLRNQFLWTLRAEADRLVNALDGRLNVLPDGSLLAWFGHPFAHLDDADRAASLAQLLHQWLITYLKTHASEHGGFQPKLGIGLASHTEVVDEKISDLYAAESFRKASVLAGYAHKLNVPLSDMLTKRLAPHTVTWLDMKTKDSQKPIGLKGVGEITALGSSQEPLKDISTLWDGLPFMQGIFDQISAGIAQWLAVESWPPAVATSLMDAIGNLSYARNFRLLRLRSPNHQRRDRLLQCYLSQVETLFHSLGLKETRLYKTGGERLSGLLAEISSLGPLMVEVYGLKALDGFRIILGEAGIDRIAPRPILVVAANLSDAGQTQTQLRLLGPRPTEQPFSRVFTMRVPEMESLPQGIRVDLQSMIDGLGDLAKSLIVQAAREPNRTLQEIVSTLSDSHHKTQACLHELTHVGLISPKQGGGFEFRDLATAQAIRQLSVPMQA
jgi:DNA-binding CsgD family transcriptional regulator